jgi:ACR3 family arsenite efflux pump ArsB
MTRKVLEEAMGEKRFHYVRMQNGRQRQIWVENLFEVIVRLRKLNLLSMLLALFLVISSRARQIRSNLVTILLYKR